MIKYLSILLITSVLLIYINNNTQDNITNLQQQFENWKIKHGIQFLDGENQYRFQIFKTNLQKIDQHNSDQSQTYRMGINQFMHLTQEQFESLYLINFKKENYVRDQPEIIQLRNSTLKASIDYRNYTVVKNQGQCNSGWAFSVTGTMEVYQKIYQKKNVSLSEQHIIDCDQLSRGCTDGSNINGYKFAIANGVATESEYPYIGYNQTCKRLNGTYHAVRYSSAVGEYNMKQALNSHPVSAGLDAQNWQFYSSGIFSNCGITLNHYAVVVGYEETGNWIVKNSWGLGWGENGFIRIKSGNTCGIVTYSYQDKYQ
ncbi:unnamed protein product [Paramecium pentaurelia]|uniref:cathepsin L n=1 Tax=Paramecium pentaurelia TaxID=43138 RepID=A0A8S1VHP6_9CILI|nr:unnamed protein product [Paramecium pentaurelia]